MFSISQKAYEAVQKEETASSESASTEDKKDDDVIDAEYVKE